MSRKTGGAPLREALTLAYGQAGRVRKQRVVYVVGRTRVHLDTVETLGSFLEIEVVLEANEAVENGVGEAEALMTRLGIEPSQLVASSYLELLQEQRLTPGCSGLATLAAELCR